MKWLKPILVVLIPVSLVLGLAFPVMAAPREMNKGAEFIKEVGKIQLIKGEVEKINGQVLTIAGKDITVNDQTRIHIPGEKDAEFADIVVGTDVIVMARENEDENVITATQLMVIPKKPLHVHQVGTVTAYSYSETDGGSITIKAKDGEEYTFTILAGKFKIVPENAEITVGESVVTVIAHRDAVTDKTIANGVAVHRQNDDEKPRLTKVSGAVTVDKTAKTLTIDTTVIKYDENTIFTLRGTPSLENGTMVTIYYTTAGDILLAKHVSIGDETATPTVTPPTIATSTNA